LYCPEEVVKQEDGLLVREMTVCTADKYLIERLKANGHEVEILEYSTNLVEEIKKINPDFIFNGADAFDGVEFHGNLLKQLEETGIPFSGCNKETTLLFTDKTKAKEFFKRCEVRTPEYQIFETKEQKLNESLQYPLIIKPVDADASEGIDEDSVVHGEEQLNKKLNEVLLRFKKVFVEKYLDGREFCVPVIFNRGEVNILPILEIDFTEHFENKPKILSFKAKWNKNTNAFKNTYSRVKEAESEVDNKIKETVQKIFTKIDSSGYATIDLRFDKENVYVLEVNPNPYLAIECDFIKAAKQVGMTSNEFVDKIVTMNNKETIKAREK